MANRIDLGLFQYSSNDAMKEAPLNIPTITSSSPVPGVLGNAKLLAVALTALVLLYIPFTWFMSPPIEQLVLAWGEIIGRVLRELPGWLYLAGVLLLLARWSGRPLADIGLRKPAWDTLLWTVIAVLATFALALLLKGLVAAIPRPAENFVADAAELRWSWGYAGFVALRAGVVEEVLFRGVLIEQLAVLSGRRWLGAVLAGLIFVGAHTHQFNWFQLLMAATATVVLTLVYMRRRNLLATICAHVLIDVVAFGHLLQKIQTV